MKYNHSAFLLFLMLIASNTGFAYDPAEKMDPSHLEELLSWESSEPSEKDPCDEARKRLNAAKRSLARAVRAYEDSKWVVEIFIRDEMIACRVPYSPLCFQATDRLRSAREKQMINETLIKIWKLAVEYSEQEVARVC